MRLDLGFKVVLISCFSGLPVFGAALTGHIYADAGLPVAQLLVTIQPTSAGQTYQATTDTQGQFSVSVPAGASYYICAQSPAASLLNSCEWALQASTVQIAANAVSKNISLTLQTGVAVTFRVNDAQGLVPPVGATTFPAIVQFGLWDSGGQYHVVPQISSDALGHTYAILVPANRNFNVTLQTNNVTVVNQSGASVSGVIASLNSAPANLAQAFVYSARAAQ